MSHPESQTFPPASPSTGRPGAPPERFEIALGTRAYRRAGEARARAARSFKARGAMLFDGGNLHLVALETGPLGGVRETDLRFARADVRDVVVDGRIVGFDVAPPGSPHAAWRDAKLRYYDDVQRSMLGIADLASLHPKPDPAVVDKLKILVADAQREHAVAIHALKAP
ncbi:hypothetical protein [Paraburkholderia ferrariae]|uniref:hypothetical protein n=1 Tax=Paraburkholderia ferrariae TaxID=386056 RepID=UPI000481DACD|nr:hypothetical protein [Paraburkholderia ferrariae]